jgi:hypothetical protein
VPAACGWCRIETSKAASAHTGCSHWTDKTEDLLIAHLDVSGILDIPTVPPARAPCMVPPNAVAVTISDDQLLLFCNGNLHRDACTKDLLPSAPGGLISAAKPGGRT